jgi:GTP-binding protein
MTSPTQISTKSEPMQIRPRFLSLFFPSRSFSTRFIDSVVLRAHGGTGGDGCSSVEGRAIGKESPDGGHGGKGGDVMLVAKEHLRDFSHINTFHIKGRDGAHGSGQGRTGRRGETLEIPVPCGTAVYRAGPSKREIRDAMEEEDYVPRRDDRERRLLADLSEPGDQFTIAKGGMPGKGNIVQSTITYEYYTPLQAKERAGRPGTSAVIELRLKTIADACLVGYPNAGKSSLLGAISHSRPLVAAYPFTTLHPHIGAVQYSDAKKVTVADLPGLVDGASQNRGMGHEFLQHVERTKVLVFVLDGAPQKHEREEFTSPADDLENLVQELELYLEGLSTRPSLVLVNKLDRPDAKEAIEEELEEIRNTTTLNCGNRIFAVSARDGTGLEPFVNALREVVEQVELDEAEELKRHPQHVRQQIFKPIPRIARSTPDRRMLLHRIKRKEATHGDVKVWRSNRKSVRNTKTVR